jgi:hypothetical protein
MHTLNLLGMEDHQKGKRSPLRRQLSQVINRGVLKPQHRRNKSVTTDSFVNPALEELKADPAEDAETALFEGNNIDFQKALTKLQDSGQLALSHQFKARWIAMRRKKIQSDTFNTENHSNGSKISYITRQQYNKVDTP